MEPEKDIEESKASKAPLGSIQESEHQSLFRSISEDTKEEKERCRLPYIVEPVVILYYFGCLGFGSLNSEYMNHRVEYDTYSSVKMSEVTNNSQAMTDLENYITSTASSWVSYSSLFRGIPSLFSVMVILPLSDIKGRRVGLTIPCFGALLKFATYMLVEFFHLPLWILLVGNLVEGLLGNHLALTGTAFAYCSDVVTAKSRSIRFTILQSSQMISGAVASLAIGYLIQYFGFFWTFVVFTLLSLAAILWTLILLPESYSSKTSDRFSMELIFQGVKNACYTVVRRRESSVARFTILWTLFGSFMFFIPLLAINEIQSLFLLNAPFYFDYVAIGNYLFLYAMLSVFIPPIFVGIFRACKADELLLLIVAATIGGISNYVEGFTDNTTALYLMSVLIAVSTSVVPVSRCILANHVLVSEQGVIQGVCSFFTAFAELIASSSMASFYGATFALLPGAVFLLMGSIMFFVALFFSYLKFYWWRNLDKHEEIAISRFVTKYSSVQ